MKKIALFAVVLLIILSIAACGKPKEISIDTEAFLGEISSGNLFKDALEPIPEKTVSSVIGIDFEQIESFSYFMGAGATAEEYGVFKCSSEEYAKKLTEQFEKRVTTQRALYETYAPDALPRLDNAIIKQSGSYAAIVIADNHSSALSVVDKYFK